MRTRESLMFLGACSSQPASASPRGSCRGCASPITAGIWSNRTDRRSFTWRTPVGAISLQPGGRGSLPEDAGRTALHRHSGHRGALWRLDSPNAYGETVFVNKDPAHPNEAYFQQVDYVVNRG